MLSSSYNDWLYFWIIGSGRCPIVVQLVNSDMLGGSKCVIATICVDMKVADFSTQLIRVNKSGIDNG
jgi:hypothetical protein